MLADTMMYDTEQLFKAIQSTYSWWIYGLWLAVIFSPKIFSYSYGVVDTAPRKRIGLLSTPRSPSRNSVVSLYRSLPLRAMSRVWGKFNELPLPEFSRHFLLSIYVRMFNCNVQEALVEDLSQYRNLGEFFRRALKPGARPLAEDHLLVMPSDGKVLNFGKVVDGTIEQVKGVNYSLKGFLGPNNLWVYKEGKSSGSCSSDLEMELDQSDLEFKGISESQHYKSLLHNKDNRLYHVVIYLAPGDYHRFHSPADWTVEHRRHFHGELLSVNPMIASYVEGLFSMNERAVYTGSWKHGFFSYTAVGATNVGSIRTYFDPKLETNTGCEGRKEMTYEDEFFPRGVSLKRGDAFGEFRLGSTIVMIFEAPKTFDFTELSLNKSVRMGGALGEPVTAKEKRARAAQA